MNKKGLFIGLTTIDIQYFVDQYPTPDTKVKTDEPCIAAGGPAANAAITYAYLGGEAHFLTCIGQNAFRQLILDDFQSCNIHTLDFLKNENFNPIVATVITTSNSERTIITHHPEVLQKRATKNIVNISDYDFIFTDGFYPELAVPICSEAKRLGLPVIFDGGSWKPQLPELIPLVDVAVCSNNYRPPGCITPEQAISFTKQLGVKKVAISRGERGIIGIDFKIEIEKVDAIDSLGAGDVLHGALCWYLMEGRNFKDALIAASKVATFSTRYKGTRSWMKQEMKVNLSI